MVQWVPDPENPTQYIPRFEDEADMGNFVRDYNYEGRAAASPDVKGMNVAEPGDRFLYAYKVASPAIEPISWGLIITIAIVAFIVGLFIVFALIPLINALVVIVHGRPREYPKGEKIDNLYVTYCPDGSTNYVIDVATNKIVSGEPCEPLPPPPPWEAILTVLVVGAVLLVGGYVVVKYVIPAIKKKEGGGK